MLKGVKHDYIMSKKVNHINFIKHYCYFEYEDNIISYLSNNNYHNNEWNECSANIITPYYRPINKFNFLEINKNKFYICVKQIILALYHIYFNCNIKFNTININNIYINNINKNKYIKYVINNNTYIINSNYIIKIDSFATSEIITHLSNNDYKIFYDNIENILSDLNITSLLDSIIGIIHEFNNDSENIVHPLKSLNIIISKLL